MGPDGPATELACTIDREEIFDGGAGRGGIPALDDPPLVTAEADEAAYLAGDDRVIGLLLGEDPVAVPHNVLWWHEIVNLDRGGRRLAVTYCPLTGSSLVFDLEEAGIDRFVVSGLNYRNNLMMSDATSSLWPQMARGARCGERRGTSLRVIPALETTWEGWKRLHPFTLVVSRETGWDRDYTRYPYGDYERLDNPETLFPVPPHDARRPPKERVLGLPVGSGGTAYPFGELREADPTAAVHDTVDGTPVVILWDGDVGGAGAYHPVGPDGPLTFGGRNGRIVDEETGSVWRIDGRATEGPLAGTRLEPVTDAYVAFWFAWALFQPDSGIWVGGR